MNEITAEIINHSLPPDYEHIYIAYSGGVDSHVLLHLFAGDNAIKDKITAVYIDHGLQAQSAAWGRHCRQIAESLHVNFRSIKVNAKPTNRQSTEESARNARYAALTQLLSENDVLLLAQHREDQMETLLLQLFRGAGIEGLAAMPTEKKLESGRLIRPFLNLSKNVIQNYADQHGLNWVEDPSNQSNEFDRNYLRNAVIPLLKTRWPALDKTVARSAKHCAVAHHELQAVIDEQSRGIFDSESATVNIPLLLGLSENRQLLVLRQCLKWWGLRSASEKGLKAIIAQVCRAAECGQAEFQLQNHLLKKYQQRLHCLPINVLKSFQPISWPNKQQCLLLSNGYQLKKITAESGIPEVLWRDAHVEVIQRQGGERIRLPGNNMSQSLKNLFQQHHVPPWVRKNIPLIYIDQQLAAVGNLWIDADFFLQQGGLCYRLQCGIK